MAFWLAAQCDGQDSDWIQRFDPRFWTVDFPRPMMAALTTPAADTLRVDCAFLTRGDLAGLAAQGVKEITLLGQNVNAYRGQMGGTDRKSVV